jgi:signal transduction histidine kinase
MRIVQAEIDRLSHLIEDLFALATNEAGGLPLTLAPVDVGAVVAEAVESVREVARRERQVTVINGVPDDLPPVLADRQRVGQVLANLLRNALRYTPAGGLVSVSAEPQPAHVLVSVADTGLGIPPEALPHLFDRFYRADAARDRDSGGAGLGLAIVRELVEAMGGRVGVESKLGQGSRFWFTLPIDAEP